jgi:hypothetical protein
VDHKRTIGDGAAIIKLQGTRRRRIGGEEAYTEFGWLFDLTWVKCLVAWLLGCLVAWLLGCLVAWLLGCLVAWCLVLLGAAWWPAC